MNTNTYTDFDGSNIIRACTRKKGYPTEAIAKKAAATVRATFPEAEVRTYGCRHCGLYHIGGTPKPTPEEVSAAARSSTTNRHWQGRRSESYRKSGRRRVRHDRDDDPTE